MATLSNSSWHQAQDRALWVENNLGGILTRQPRITTTTVDRNLSLLFKTNFHPYAGELARRMLRGSLRDLQDADTARVEGGNDYLLENREFFAEYNPDPDVVAEDTWPIKELDFAYDGPYAVYNMELFYHAPMAIALHLSKNGRHEEAQEWFHYIFDPTDDSDAPSPERFWKVKPFQTSRVARIEEILLNLSTNQDAALHQSTVDAITAWAANPFHPHAIARYRPSAYMLKAIMAYLENLISWGDELFRQDTVESINEATQHYVTAASILGPKPQPVPRKGRVGAQTYKSLRKDLDEFANALREVEVDIPFDLAPYPVGESGSGDPSVVTIASVGQTLYFCLPRNDRLLGLWDEVADRLFKIHNSLNLQGEFRQLPLFEPPIDPALLAKAAAAGVDVSAVVAGMNQPLPLIKFPMLLQRAVEVCQEVKGLGSQLLSALEKHDAETLSILRAGHERTMLSLAESVRYAQWQEAKRNVESTLKSIVSATQRYVYYERLLGMEEAAVEVPEMDALDSDAMQKQKFAQRDPDVEARGISIDTVQVLANLPGGPKLSPGEVTEMIAMNISGALQLGSGIADALGAILKLLPQFGVDIKPFGSGAGAEIGGEQLGGAAQGIGTVLRVAAGLSSHIAGQVGKIASYGRREQDWAYQSTAAIAEINQTYRQLRAAQIRAHIAEREYRNHQQQIRNAEEIERFLSDERSGKKTGQALYSWMQREVRGLHTGAVQFAHELARKAERAARHELGDDSISYLSSSYLGGREGLLAGERLLLDLKRLDVAYQESNIRERELTRDVSLFQLNPGALVALRTAGVCEFEIAEDLFDLDVPGSYFRRLRGVALTIPCTVGPFTSVNCTLTLVRSSIRTSSRLTDGEYVRQGTEDVRFSDNYASTDSIVTSKGNRDAGLFQAESTDGRRLPFEGEGAISAWRLEFPSTIPQFDREQIADVILHLRYTCRSGGAQLRDAANTAVEEALAAAQGLGSTRLISVRQEFPSAWARFRATKIPTDQPTADLTLDLGANHYPYWSQGRLNAVHGVDLIAPVGNPVSVSVDLSANGGPPISATLESDPTLQGAPSGTFTAPLPDSPIGSWTFSLTNNSFDDLWLLVTWGM